MSASEKSLAVLLVAGLMVGGAGYGVWSTLDGRQQTIEAAKALTAGDPAHGGPLVRRFGCGGCHTISGVHGADGKVGPSLEKLRERVFIAGHLRNSGETLVQFILQPQQFDAHAAMPPTGITESQARDVAAYLYTQ